VYLAYAVYTGVTSDVDCAEKISGILVAYAEAEARD
jgi:hypothetical protein